MVGLRIELFGSGEVVVFALVVLVALDVSRDEFGSPSRTLLSFIITSWSDFKYQLDESTSRYEGLLVLEKAFVVAVRRDTQVICGLMP
jgi:hypothetical protein